MLRSSPLRVLALALATGLVAAGGAAIVRAGDTPATAPAAPKAVQSAFLRGLVGSWDTEMTEGDLGRYKGRSTWRLLMGDTAVSEDYASSMTTEEGKTVPWLAHVVCREGADGKSIEAWMFDNQNVPPQRFAGTLTDAGFDASSDNADGRMRITCAKQGADRIFRLYLSDALLVTEVYRPAAK